MLAAVRETGMLGIPLVSFVESGPMPRIANEFLNAVFWCYGSRGCAERRESCGGTGFLFEVHCTTNPAMRHVFGITNRHVIESHCQRSGVECAAPFTLALNLRADDDSSVLALIERDAPREWVTPTDNTDLAICYISYLPKNAYFWCIPQIMVLTEERYKNVELGPGDETFMVGRFVNHDGRATNAPSVRFGHISMNPGEPIQSEKYGPQLSFLVEMISQAGFSGSPVFFHFHPGNPRKPSERRPPPPITPNTWEIGLLGVDWGQINSTRYPVYDAAGSKTDSHVLWPTGANGVVPGWKILDLLKHPKVRNWMMAAENAAKTDASQINAAIPHVRSGSAQSTKVGNPSHKEDFRRLLGAATAKRPEGDQT